MGLLIIESDVRFYKRGVLEKRGRGVIEVKKILGGWRFLSTRNKVGGRGGWAVEVGEGRYLFLFIVEHEQLGCVDLGVG